MEPSSLLSHIVAAACGAGSSSAHQILAPVSRATRSRTMPKREGKAAPLFYKAVSVFDISQTEGEELASPVRLLDGDDAGLFASLARVAVCEGLSLRRDAQEVSANGRAAGL